MAESGRRHHVSSTPCVRTLTRADQRCQGPPVRSGCFGRPGQLVCSSAVHFCWRFRWRGRGQQTRPRCTPQNSSQSVRWGHGVLKNIQMQRQGAHQMRRFVSPPQGLHRSAQGTQRPRSVGKRSRSPWRRNLRPALLCATLAVRLPVQPYAPTEPSSLAIFDSFCTQPHSSPVPAAFAHSSP